MTDEVEAEVIDEVEDDAPPAPVPGMTIEKRVAELAERTDQDNYDRLYEMAKQIADTDLVPKGLKNRPSAILATMLTGKELGIAPMQSLRQIYVTDDGSVGMEAELMLTLARRAGHKIVEQSVDEDGASITGERGDNGERMTVTFTQKDAEVANLLRKTNYQRYKLDMFWARAIARLSRRLWPDVVLGAGYTPEELGTVRSDTGDAKPAEPPAPAQQERVDALRAVLDHISVGEGKDGWEEEAVVKQAARSFNRQIEKLEDLTDAEVTLIATSIKDREGVDVFPPAEPKK